MNFSAAVSRSCVVTPGRILAARRSIVLTRISPAAAIWSIWAGDFLMITAVPRVAASPRSRGCGRAPQACRAGLVVPLGLVARAVEASQEPAPLVVVLQLLGLLGVGVEALLDRVGLVV